MEIIADTLAEAHEGAVDAVLHYGNPITIQTHVDKEEYTIEYRSADGSDDIFTIKVLHPTAEPRVSAGALFGEKFTKAYEKQFLTLTPPRDDGMHATYTYWNRLEDHPTYDELEHGDGRGDGEKQITSLIEKLAKDPNSRRAVAITWNPIADMNSTEPPCMLFVQFVIRNGKVNMRILFRSQDILSGLGENLVGCSAMLTYVTNAINVLANTHYKSGMLTLISIIPHIYKKRDSFELQKMQQEIHRKKTFGLWKVKFSRTD